MPTVADVLRRYGPKYIARFKEKMPRASQGPFCLDGLSHRAVGNRPLRVRFVWDASCDGTLVRQPALCDVPAG